MVWAWAAPALEALVDDATVRGDVLAKVGAMDQHDVSA